MYIKIKKVKGIFIIELQMEKKEKNIAVNMEKGFMIARKMRTVEITIEFEKAMNYVDVDQA